MGWLDTILSVATAGASIYSASQLQSMRAQGAQAEMIQALLAHLREEIFRLKQAAEAALALEAQSAKRAAGAISLVAAQLQETGITPELFSELGDKEYAAQTIRLIRDNQRRLLALLSPGEQGEVSRMMAAAERLPDYSYYLDNYNDGQRLLEAERIDARYSGRNGGLVRTGLALVIIMAAVAAMAALLTPGTGVGTSGGGSGTLPLLLVAGGVAVAGLVLLGRWQHAKEYKQAKKDMAELKDAIDRPRFVALDNKFSGQARAQELQTGDRALIAAFFGDASSQPALIQVQPGMPTQPGVGATASAIRTPTTSTSTVGSEPPRQPAVAPPAATGEVNFCPDCGAKQPRADARFCLKCGASLQPTL